MQTKVAQWQRPGFQPNQKRPRPVGADHPTLVASFETSPPTYNESLRSGGPDSTEGRKGRAENEGVGMKRKGARPDAKAQVGRSRNRGSELSTDRDQICTNDTGKH